MKTSFDAAVVGAGPAGCRDGDPARPRRLVGGADRARSVSAAQGLRRVRRGEQSARCSTRSASAPSSSAAPAPSCVGSPCCAATRRSSPRCRAAEDRRLDRWGRALGREQLDTLLADAAEAAGATSFAAVLGAGDRRRRRRLSLARATGAPARDLELDAHLVVAAHGSWEPLPAERAVQRGARAAKRPVRLQGELSRRGDRCRPVAGAVVRRRLRRHGRRRRRPGDARLLRPRRSPAGAACASSRERVPATSSRRCCGASVPASTLRSAGAERVEGPWLASGPLRPGIRLGQGDGVFRVGNAAGEAHPIVGEGISMALQSAFVLADLIGQGRSDLRRRPTRRAGAAARACRLRSALAAPVRTSPAASPRPSPTSRCGRPWHARRGRWCGVGRES